MDAALLTAAAGSAVDLTQFGKDPILNIYYLCLLLTKKFLRA
jgi:hypothetical protein